MHMIFGLFRFILRLVFLAAGLLALVGGLTLLADKTGSRYMVSVDFND